jgi:hypothetical protein
MTTLKGKKLLKSHCRKKQTRNGWQRFVDGIKDNVGVETGGRERRNRPAVGPP